jgi:hypothetical protein
MTAPASAATFVLPDSTTSLPTVAFEFDPAARERAAAILDAAPAAMFHRLLRDQESQECLLAARRILAAFLSRPAEAPATEAGRGAPHDEPEAEALVADVLGARAELAGQIAALRKRDPEVREAVLRQRAPLALLGGCWLDTVSQPATQPAVVVNRLFAQHFEAQGQGNPQRGWHHLRRRALESAGVFLPEIDAVDFLRRAHARPLTAVHGAFYLALSRLPASFLPEVVGVHYAISSLGVDDLLLGLEPVVPQRELDAALAEYLELTAHTSTGAADRRRLPTALRLAVRLEREHVAALTELADWQAGLSVEARAAAIIGRHSAYAGRQHRNVRVGGRLLTEIFDDPDFDLAEFVRLFRDSRQLKPMRGEEGRFLRAIKFGGPMFGIFDEREAAVFKEWADAVAAGDLPEVELSPNRAGDEEARHWQAAIAASDSADVVYAPAAPADDRQLFHRLVNIETYANTLPLARQRAEETLKAAEVLFTFGGGGHYTDATYFDYSPEALYERVERIYWDKLVDPYRPLTEIPDREEVIFGQKTFALGSLIDGTWAYRIGNLGRYRRVSDGMLFSIYADEMGRGDLRKNHITLIYQVLSSLGIRVPHIRDVAFLEQGELPDHLYGFSIHQICLALFADSFYNEILGYNLGIEMFGLGEMRMHEMQKLSHHGFDIGYEEAHLSIDNVSSGHARQSADIIVAYLDEVARTVGATVVQDEWRRIWRGYASFAYFVEHALVRDLAMQSSAELVI